MTHKHHHNHPAHMKPIRRTLHSAAMGYLWASPWSLVGCLFGFLSLLFKGKIQVNRGALEFHSGIIHWLFKRLPNSPGAMTIGHTIFARTQEDLEHSREHEHVHIRQYERWGIFFIPAYLLCSIYLKLRGKNPYYDNPFEVEAYSKEP